MNAKPLNFGLADQPDLDLRLLVPSALLATLADGSADVSLLPIIDYQALPGLRLIPSGGIACEGPTLTVRLFSRTPIEAGTVLAVDGDSHTSVVLARLMLQELFALRPRVVPLANGSAEATASLIADSTADATAWATGAATAGLSAKAARSATTPGGAGEDGQIKLLIGDKVVCEEPAGYPFQLDLGEAWYRLTGLPFVFAAWVARGGVDLGDLPARLTAAREAGMHNIQSLVRDHAVPRGWPADIARRYYTQYLKFALGPRHLEAIRLFHTMAADAGLIDRPVRPLLVEGEAQPRINRSTAKL